MIRTDLVLAALVAALSLGLACGSSKNMKVGEKKEMKDDSGKVVGKYEQITDKELHASYDSTQNGINEKVVTAVDGKINRVDYFDDKTGNITRSVSYVDGKPSGVQTFLPDGKTLQAESVLDATNKVKEVTLPVKKKKVVFNADGTSTVSDLK